MTQLQYTIAPEIFDLFPTFKRGVIVCKNVCNTNNQTFDFSSLNSQLNITMDNIAESEPVSAWRKVFRTMGVDPTKERVSFEGLTRRLLNKSLIKVINPVVDLGNFFSILHQCPVGAHPVTTDSVKIDLKKAIGNEIFIPLGSSTIEKVNCNEVILTDGDNTLTRRFCWRQGTSSLVTTDTTDLFVNFDFIHNISTAEINKVITDFKLALKLFSPELKSESFILALGSEKHLCYF